MKCIVTGAAGFIGSHLCEALLNAGHEVVAVDAFVPYYPKAVKQRNLQGFLSRPNCQFFRIDLAKESVDELVSEAEIIFHLAAMPGLVRSWTDLEGYYACNVLATQKLLEAIQRSAVLLRRLIFASTSSVYGKYASGDETMPCRPISPYGITKLAAEHLCRAYAETYNLPLVTLRYFSVYGPRQRPDMGYHRFIRAILTGEPVIVNGDGQQVRGNTYISDCVEATLAAMKAPIGEIYNIGGGEAASVWDILHRLEKLAGRSPKIRHEPERPGDQRYTFADTTRFRRHTGWEPKTTLDDGLAHQWEWQVQEVSYVTPAAER